MLGSFRGTPALVLNLKLFERVFIAIDSLNFGSFLSFRVIIDYRQLKLLSITYHRLAVGVCLLVWRRSHWDWHDAFFDNWGCLCLRPYWRFKLHFVSVAQVAESFWNFWFFPLRSLGNWKPAAVILFEIFVFELYLLYRWLFLFLVADSVLYYLENIKFFSATLFFINQKGFMSYLSTGMVSWVLNTRLVDTVSRWICVAPSYTHIILVRTRAGAWTHDDISLRTSFHLGGALLNINNGSVH